jgi:hypothetical protein
VRPPARPIPADRRLELTLDHVWTVAAIAVPVIAALFARLTTIDLAYHVRLGDTMLATGTIPDTDAFTFTASGVGWMNQQWAAQLILALVRRGGWESMIVLHAACLALTYSFLWLACRTRGANVGNASALTMGSFAISSSLLELRPQLLALPLFAVSLWLVARRHDHPRGLWLLPLLTVVWVNIHGSFILVPLLLGLAHVEDLSLRSRASRTTMAAGFAAIVASLANPYGPRVWAYALEIGTNQAIRERVIEWAPTSVGEPAGVLFFVSVAAVAGYLAWRRVGISSTDLLWLGVFFSLGVVAFRGVVWWALVAPVVVAGLLSSSRPTAGARGGSRMLNLVFVASLLGLVILGLPWWRTGATDGSRGSNLLADAPQGLVRGVASSVVPGSRVFVPASFASWFEYRLPSMYVFVDSRIELFPERIWDDYFRVTEGRHGWRAALDRWRVDAVVTDAGAVELRGLLDSSPAWLVVYDDEEGAVFVRR